MSGISRAEQYLLKQIRRGDEQAWSRFVQRYRGRLLSFAQMKLRRRADAEDIVQDTFMAFVTAIGACRGESSLETYLFTILRHKIINLYRSAHARRTCLIQDVYRSLRDDDGDSDVYEYLASDEATASFYARRDEHCDLLRRSLAEALGALVDGYKKDPNFRDLKIVELLFYCQLANRDIAKIVDAGDKNIAVIKHRCIKHVRRHVARCGDLSGSDDEHFEDLLTQVW
ncbi:MAG: hypothetical protein DRP66_10000, partial [Planctomycetota bacterium]